MNRKRHAATAIVLTCVIYYALGTALLLTTAGCEWAFSSGSGSSVDPNRAAKPHLQVTDQLTEHQAPPSAPAPGAIILGGIGVATVSWLRRQRKL